MQMEAVGWSEYQNVLPKNILQGDFGVSADGGTYFSTILGSCVAVCLFDEKNGVGGMNHILLPGDETNGGGHVRYGVHLMELLINGILRLNGEKAELKAKVFGGAQVSVYQTGIGEKNGRFVKDFLNQEGIRCVSESLGGVKARKVHFVPTIGLARQLLIDPPRDLQEKERPKEKIATPASEITLF